FCLQNFFISSLLPGSCARKLLAGKPRMANPLSLYCSYSFSRPAYCGVYPHWLATFTINTTLPLYADSGAGAPSMDGNVNSCTLEAAKAEEVSIARRVNVVFIAN